MQFTKTEKGYLIRLLKGENLVETLTSFCAQQQIHAGVFSAIGSAAKAELGYFNPEKKEFSFTSFTQSLEIVSLWGNVSLVGDKPFLHIHAVLSDDKLACHGGHLKEAVIGPTCEVFLTDLQMTISREYDESIGLNLLQCESKSNS